MMRTVTEYPLVWNGIDATLEVETIRVGGGGGDAFRVTSAAPMPINHWDTNKNCVSWSLGDPDWFAEQDPVEYALDCLDAFAKGNADYLMATTRHVATTRQGELF